MLNVFEMCASLGLDSSGFEKGLGDAEGKTNNLSATTVAVGKVMADTFESVIKKVGEFASEVVEAGAQQETALAKVNTIMDTSVMNTEAMSGAIKDLSNDMGVSVTELSDTVYNAISATGDTAHAVELAGQASKLASAGFTDTSSALSVLTTAMNAYGLEADQTQHISDSLITVQNLGVTTVSELSSSMGKAIASASAYGVNLENLESAYISITKAGINTAEGTTYISSMMKELGDDGTDVAKVLKEKTGMAFNELLNAVNPATNELYSMGDVLGILYESVGEDSTALMNLWSSAEAGKASSAIVGQGLDDFNDHLKQLQNTSGETQDAYEVMADTFEHRQEVMTNKIENMKATLFDKFEPMLVDMFDFVESTVMPLLDEGIENLDIIVPVTMGFVTALGALAVALNFSSMVDTLKTSFTALNTAMSANPIGLVIALIAGLVVALVELYKHNEKFRAMVNSAWSKIQDFWNKCKELPSKFTQLGENIVDGIKNGIKEKWEQFKDWFNGLFDGLVDGVKDLLGIHSPSRVFASIGSYMAQGLGEGWDDEFGDVQRGINNSLDFSAVPISVPNSTNYSQGSVINQTININREISTADELAQAIRIESRYGLMEGVALG